MSSLLVKNAHRIHQLGYKRCFCSVSTNGTFSAERLEEFSLNIFEKLGLSHEDASIVGKSLVKANLRGQDGHGVSRIPIYSKRLRCGLVNARANIRLTEVTPIVMSCDGDHGMGVVVARKAMDRAISMAKVFGMGMVGVRNSTHFGASAEYVQQALDANMMSIVFTNSSPALPVHGGRQPFLGASPIAAGAPSMEGHPFLMDMASTVVARGKLRLAAERGEPIAPGIGLDRHGNPTTDGMEAFHGVTLPFGGVKGAAISLMMDIFAGLYTGAAFGGEVSSLYNDFTTKQNCGHLIIAMRCDLFVSEQQFHERMKILQHRMKSQPRAAGFSDILMVGEPESMSEKSRRLNGIPIQKNVINALNEEARILGTKLL